jgi:excisionase family DNA binding protein
MKNCSVTKEEIPTLLSADELAARFQCDRMTIYRAAWKGEIPSVKIGNLRRFAPAAIQAMIEAGGTLDQTA